MGILIGLVILVGPSFVHFGKIDFGDAILVSPGMAAHVETLSMVG